jgi:hypothetical protein
MRVNGWDFDDEVEALIARRKPIDAAQLADAPTHP